MISYIIYHIASLKHQTSAMRVKLAGSSDRKRSLALVAHLRLAQDKGGPSKGGFLNYMLISYTDIGLCNEINDMCIINIYIYIYIYIYV